MSLSAGDYHLHTLYVPPAAPVAAAPRGALEAIGPAGSGTSASAPRGRLARRLGRAERVGQLQEQRHRLRRRGLAVAAAGRFKLKPSAAAARKAPEGHPAAATPGLKLFIQSPYDCVLAVKRDLADHLAWLVDRRRYKDAWELVCEHPEAVPVSAAEEAASLDEVQGTPTRQRSRSLRDFFADDAASRTSVSASRARSKAVEAERRRVGELWLQQLVAAGEWAAAGRAAGTVLGASPRWEHWVWTFAQAGRFDDITPHIPAKPLSPPLPSVVYERLLGHYIFHDCLRFKKLIELWDPELFNIQSVTSAIENKLAGGEVREDTVEGGIMGRDWRILMDALAKLFVADNRPKDALRCYVKLHNADAAMGLIAEYHLAEAVADDIPGFLSLRLPGDQLGAAPLSEIEEASADAIRLLVEEALTGIVPPSTVVDQLRARGPAFEPFLFLYLRALWKGQGADARPYHHRTRARAEAEGRALLELPRRPRRRALRGARPAAAGRVPCARRAGTRTTGPRRRCEARGYHAELVYLLAQTGQTKRALGLIIHQLGDVGLAIDFTREQGDAELWDDLLDFSMDKPRFIRGLLERVGTSVDPIRLVRRIPEGLEIEGLRDGVWRVLMREFEIQGSISEGAARVLRGEGWPRGWRRCGRGARWGSGSIAAPPEEDGEKEAAADDAAEGRRGEAPPGHCGPSAAIPIREGAVSSPPFPALRLPELTTRAEPDALVGFCVRASSSTSRARWRALGEPALAAAAERLRGMLAPPLAEGAPARTGAGASGPRSRTRT